MEPLDIKAPPRTSPGPQSSLRPAPREGCAVRGCQAVLQLLQTIPISTGGAVNLDPAPLEKVPS